MPGDSETEEGTDALSTQTVATNPIPGLMIEIHVIPPSATETTYDVLTDHDGHPAAAIEVASNSDIMLLSKEARIAQLQVAAPAVDFAIEHRAKVFAAPMVDPVSVCRESTGETGRIRFMYQNLNKPLQEVLIPISSLSPAYFRNPTIPTDDLLLNDVRTNANQPLAPDGDLNTSTSGDTYQTFHPDQGIFTVTYDLRNGPLTWNLIGKSLIVDDSLQSCDAPAKPQCSKVANAKLKTIYREFIKTIRSTVTAGAKSLRKGTGRHINTTPHAIKTLKQLVKVVLSLKSVHVCEAGAIVPQSCRMAQFPHTTLLKLHKGLFKQAQLTNPKAFEKVRQTYHKQYGDYLQATFPNQVYICTSPQ